MLLEQQISILVFFFFFKDDATLKPGVMAAENVVLPSK